MPSGSAFPEPSRPQCGRNPGGSWGFASKGGPAGGGGGTLATKYMLYRDRKALANNYVNMLGYLVLTVVLSYWLCLWLIPESYR